MTLTILLFTILNFVFTFAILGHLVEIKKEIRNMKVSDILQKYFKQN